MTLPKRVETNKRLDRPRHDDVGIDARPYLDDKLAAACDCYCTRAAVRACSAEQIPSRGVRSHDVTASWAGVDGQEPGGAPREILGASKIGWEARLVAAQRSKTSSTAWFIFGRRRRGPRDLGRSDCEKLGSARAS